MMRDGVSALQAVAAGSAEVTALVPAKRIVAGVLPKGTPLPAIALETISGMDRQTVAKEPTAHVTERVQATILAATAPQVRAVLRALRKLGYAMPADAAITGVVVMTDSMGPGFLIEGSNIHGITQDFRVSYTETR